MKYAEFLTKHPKKIVAVMLVITAVCLVLFTMVPVNYNVADYMDKAAPSTVAIDVMDEAFPGGVPNARLMVSGLTMAEALELKDTIAAIDGVTEITWLDDVSSSEIPIEYLGDEATKNYYKDGNVLYTLTLDGHFAVPAVREAAVAYAGDAKMSGLQVSSSYANETIWNDLAKIMIIAVPIVLAILIITTSSWLEPVLFLATIGVAIVINMGSNIIFGEISYITSGVAALLQLAISIDYAIFLMHRFDEYRRTGMGVTEAIGIAMKKSFASVWSSGIVAAIGFVALVAMRLGIGPDLGWVMVKGILISLLCVYSLLPALVVLTSKLIDKTKHRPFLPSFKKFAKVAKKICIPVLIVAVIILVPSVSAVFHNTYSYFDLYKDDSTPLGKDTQDIKDKFGDFSQMVLMVPDGYSGLEKKLLAEIEAIPVVSEVQSFGKTVGAEVPEGFVPPDTREKLISGGFTRYAITVDTTTESPEAFQATEIIRAAAEKYYPGIWYLAGEIPTSYDLKQEVTEDDIKIVLISVIGILFVLMLVFRSVIVPPILVIGIESAIFINCGLPYFMGDEMFYITRMVIFAIQLGATVDFSILIASRYFEYRREVGRAEAIQGTLENATVSVLTSAGILMASGFIMAAMSSNPLLSEIGMFIGRGSLLSIVAVVIVLPAFLLIFDKLIQKLSLKMNFVPDPMTLKEVIKS